MLCSILGSRWGRQLSHSALHWCGPTSSAVCNFGCLNIKRTSNCLSVSRGGQPGWWKISTAKLPRNRWGHLACSSDEKKAEGWPCHSQHLPQGGSGGGGADLLFLVTSDRTWGNRMKMRQWKCRLDIKKRFFTKRVLCHWNRVPREVVTAPSLSELKEHLDSGLIHTV